MEDEIFQSLVQTRDSNTSFFLKKSQQRRHKNTLQKIQMKMGQVLENFDQIKEAAMKKFGNLYTHERIEGEEINEQVMVENRTTCISEEENNSLVREISEEEISQEIWGLGQDKALQPDRFPIHFLKLF